MNKGDIERIYKIFQNGLSDKIQEITKINERIADESNEVMLQLVENYFYILPYENQKEIKKLTKFNKGEL